jgi:hypothetical protein
LIHLVWPSWWKPQYEGHDLNGSPSIYREFWMPPEPDATVAKAEWEGLWRLFTGIGLVKRLHITIFQVYTIREGTNVFNLDEILLPLKDVKAIEFLVEAWGEEERIDEPTAERPFRLHLNPALS